MKNSKNKKNNSSVNKKSEGKSLKKKKFKKRDRRGRILVKNLSFKVTEAEVRKYFSKYGKVSEVELPHHDDGKIVGCGFVQFSGRDKAARAVADSNGKEFMGRTLDVSFALSKLSYIAARPDEVRLPSITGRQVSAAGTVISRGAEKAGAGLPEAEHGVGCVKQEMELGDFVVKQEPADDSSEEKQNKEKPLQKRGRLIVRNLPFKVTEESLKEHFSQFGEVHSVSLLRQPDGKLVGCGFVQFTWKQNAAKAILKTSGKPFMGRVIIVDWAVPKNVFESRMQEEETTDVKTEPEDEVVTIKEEVEDDMADAERKQISKECRDSSSDDSSQSDDDNEVENDAEDEDEASEGSMASDAELMESPQQRTVSNDVAEGCTVFVKNIPFSVTSEQLRTCVEQFGDVVYALVCIDPLTEHSRGTGFVKFKSKESTEQCLSAGEALQLCGQQLEVLPALARQEVQDRAHNRKAAARNRDSRNLYLVKEGVVVAGSTAAAGVSAADMARRLQLEQWKSQILRNLNMFVSRTRLVIHNLPPSWDDAKMRRLFSTHAPPGIVIKEARVMRDKRDVDVHGVPKSKEYGFVTFMSHEEALHSLRSINNNPKIFTPAKRPIVSFSIENKVILNLRQRRLMKSREKNPLAGEKERSRVQGGSREEDWRNRPPAGEGEEELGAGREWFTGVAARPGKVKMRSRFNLRKQAALHGETIRQEKRRRKDQRRVAQLRQPANRVVPQTQVTNERRKKLKGEQRAEEVFGKLVDKYKSKLSSVSKVKKWYE